MEMKIKHYPIGDLISAEYNPRQLTNDQFSQLKDSVKRFGLVDPIIINTHKDRKNIVVGGHQRIRVAEALNIKKIPCVEVKLNLEKERELNIRLNKNTGEWDYDNLANFFDMDELRDWGFSDADFKLFDIEEVVKDGLTDDDATPEVEEAVTKLGDLWLLGEHRLLCGDSTTKENVELLMDGQKADMVFTSPPYNADAKTGDGDIFNNKKSKDMYIGDFNDNKSSKQYINFTTNVLAICFQYTDGFIFWNVSYNAKSKFEYIAQIQPSLEYLVEQICWKKSSTIPFKGMLMRDWEPIYIFSTNKQSLDVKKVTSNYWDINNTNSQQKDHKACFPVALPEKGIGLININSGIILDPFLGSGSTLIACEKNNRKCYGMELDPHYCDVIVKRWENYTGKTAKLLELEAV